MKEDCPFIDQFKGMKKHIVLLQFCEATPESEEDIKQRTAFLGLYLSKNDCQVTWIKSGFSHDTKKNLWGDSVKNLNDNFKIVHIPGIGYKNNVCVKRYIHDWICSFQALKILKNLGHIDAIVSCVPSVGASFLASRFSKKRNIPFILDLRDAWPDALPYALSNPLFRFLAKLAILPDRFFLKQALKNATAVVSMSNDMLHWGMEKIKPTTKPTKVFYLSSTKDIHLSEEEIKIYSEKYAHLLARQTFKVFYISRWGKMCNPMFLLRVAKEFLNDNIDFVICGDGDYAEQIVKSAECLSNVFLPGFVSEKEGYFLAKHCNCGVVFISEESQEHDKYVIPSFPNKVFFQFMCGLPLINGMSGELSKVVSEKNIGVNFSNNNIEEVKKHVSFLKNNFEAYQKMGRNSRKFFEDFGNPEVTYQQYTEFVKDFVNENGFYPQDIHGYYEMS